MATNAPLGQQGACIPGRAKKMQEVILAVVEELDDGEQLNTLFTKDENTPSELARALVMYYDNDDVEEFYSELRAHLAAEPSTLIAEVAWFLKPIVGPSQADRDHKHDRICKHIADCLKRISRVAVVSLEAWAFWNDLALRLETNAYNDSLDSHEYTEVTDKIRRALKDCKKANAQHDDDIKSCLLVAGCVADGFWDDSDDEGSEDASKDESDEDDMATSRVPAGVVTAELQLESWARIEKALRSCMGRFP